MLRPLLLRPPRRMKRVREKEKGCNQTWFLRTKHAGLASSVRVARNQGTSVDHCRHRSDCIFQTGAIAGSIRGAGRAKRSDLPERQVAAEDHIARLGEGFRHSSQQRSLGIASGTMCQDKPVTVRNLRSMQKSANVRVNRCVCKISDRDRTQDIILNRYY